ncbi:accessory gene regulator B family protein [Clostridium botulinum]|uniref:Accessory regulator AgrB n=1 Tax=Clostridium botulinum TaxID=1491 RepID=A0A6B4JKT7_CLOBO|nr:accessory gene regulator B family protein [Clostridium botulinum]EES49075.1 putative accessory gene regulator protein B [Clostridium botulinum E1 str. 'BoNT E Beluga']MBY6760954.1 accessory gene regulator B family protein [Clostridium botulinum]MBY6919754.1 accessory gene regulator B family protein [Clostridium botulinum]MCR1130745.1 accessory gene regulator B family protein [Clostridium botulinum]NFJ57638.1 accessory regulator AgrB [Clostridium botulinum]
MLKIEYICEKISNYVAEELNFDDDKKSIINYGIFAFIQIGICIVLVAIFGFVFNVTIEALIVSFTISILRKSSGGVHASSPERCAIIGTVASVGMALIAKSINANFSFVILFGIIVFVWSYYILYKLAPVDSIAKPIKNIEKRKRLKKSSIIMLSTYLIIVIINILSYLAINNFVLLTYSLCIYMGLLWQIFSLTKSGHLILGKLNNF